MAKKGNKRKPVDYWLSYDYDPCGLQILVAPAKNTPPPPIIIYSSDYTTTFIREVLMSLPAPNVVVICMFKEFIMHVDFLHFQCLCEILHNCPFIIGSSNTSTFTAKFATRSILSFCKLPRSSSLTPQASTNCRVPLHRK